VGIWTSQSNSIFSAITTPSPPIPMNCPTLTTWPTK
jgi:hypothetical protein